MPGGLSPGSDAPYDRYPAPMAATVHVDFRKWGDRKHWQFDMRRLGEDEHGVWLWSPPGTRLQRGDEPPKRSKRLFLKLVTPDAWWSPLWNEQDEREIYVDVATPAVWDGDVVTMTDLDLDVLRYRDGRVVVEDEDEFEAHRALYAYPPDVVQRARATTAEVVRLLTERQEPFGRVGEAWLARARAAHAAG